MHLAFVDIVYDYAADRPFEDRALGGTTSAICFLAQELTKAGITCTLFNKIKERRTVLGIEARPIDDLIDERFNPAYTAFIFCGRWVDWMTKSIREASNAPLIAWMHEAAMVPPLTAALPEFNGIVFVSEWQKRMNQKFVPPDWKQAVIPSGMNPAFASMFPPGAAILDAKSNKPLLVYVGVTPRGVFHIPPILDHLRAKRSDFTMEIFCNVTPTRDAATNEKYITWMRSLPNVTHVGQVGQSAYAARLKEASVMVSPNPWPETQCIAMVEAMAAGLNVITTNRAVLPETAHGFAKHIPIEDADHPLRFDMPMPYEDFATAIDEALTRREKDPTVLEADLRRQVDSFVATYRWPQFVALWQAFLGGFG